MFSEKVELVNTSNHYSREGETPADVPGLESRGDAAVLPARFANAADFTYFFVGAFTVAEMTPLLERWVAALPVDGQEDLGLPRHGRALPGRGRARRK